MVQRILSSPDKVELYKKRYEEGYDLDDPSYTAWLKINHPTEVCSNTTKSSSSLVSGELLKESRDLADSGKSKLSSGDALSEILALPRPVPRATSKRKPALNAKAVCITDDTVLEVLKRKEVEKAEAEKEKETKKIERECKKKTREEKQLERERKKIVDEEKRLERECKKIVGEEKRLVEEQKNKCAVNNERKTRSRKNCTQEMMSLQLCVCHRVQVMKTAIPLKEIQKTTPHAQSVALGMPTAWRSGFVVMGVTSGSTKSVQI